MKEIIKHGPMLDIMLVGIAAFLVTSVAFGATDVGVQAATVTADPHANHRQMMQNKNRYVKTTSVYTLPDVSVIDQNGDREQFRDLLATENPLVLNFIFTSCTTICPVLSATFSQAQKDLQAQEMPPVMISVSIDPDYDTPERLLAYAETFHAGSNWKFLTGGKDNMLEIQKSFDVYRGDKLNHVPVTYLRSSPRDPWVRLDGFTSSRQLVQEYKDLISVGSD